MNKITQDKNEEQKKEKKIERDDTIQNKEEVKKPNQEEINKRELKEEIHKWKQNYLRTLADYDNLERRTYQQNKESQTKTTKTILLKFLDVLDDIEQGNIFIKDKGLQLVKDKFIKILSEEGIRELEVVGKPFDPYTSECVEVVAGNKDNVIIEVLRKGYTLHDEIIRPARVKVEKKTE
ncbi:MAG TPA: nucleotide exchange factor GrpE [Patescibacteria group bacterium]|nr:nucleotide exchange factor GrpE [Patescibacteria group bacterium]